MERLPYIDEHATDIAAPPERVWAALTAMMRSELAGGRPRGVARLLGCDPATASGGFAAPAVHPGQTLPGFLVAGAEAPRVLELRGRHRFSRYGLTFELEDRPPSGTRVRAMTHAAFPGALGRLYRAAVIGTGAHRVVVRRMLRETGRRAAT